MAATRSIPRSTPAPSAPPLPARLRLVITRLSRRLRQQAEPDVSPTQQSVLASVERHGPVTLGELAALERVQPPTITAAIGRLEERGLVARAVDAADRRVARVSVTLDGRKLLEQGRRRKSAYLDRRLRRLTDDERATLERATEILERIVDDEG